MTQLIAFAFTVLIAACALSGLCGIDDNDNKELEVLLNQLE